MLDDYLPKLVNIKAVVQKYNTIITVLLFLKAFCINVITVTIVTINWYL